LRELIEKFQFFIYQQAISIGEYVLGVQFQHSSAMKDGHIYDTYVAVEK
jgi:hypothetical protein